MHRVPVLVHNIHNLIIQSLLLSLGIQNPVGASNREPEPEPEKISHNRIPKQGGSGVAYAEPKEYESGKKHLSIKILINLT